MVTTIGPWGYGLSLLLFLYMDRGRSCFGASIETAPCILSGMVRSRVDGHEYVVDNDIGVTSSRGDRSVGHVVNRVSFCHEPWLDIVSYLRRSLRAPILPTTLKVVH